MLKNAPTLAIGGADPAENEPPKVRQVSNKIRRNIGRGGEGRRREGAPSCSHGQRREGRVGDGGQGERFGD